jgi:glutamate N-acetyltransferase/amino-acid N-acetyltransferase
MIRVYKKLILPKGFIASGLHCGIKRKKPDLALFYSTVAAKAACKFTTNKIQAAPLLVCKEHLKKAKLFQAIIVNSGNANCFTGKIGIKDAQETTLATAKALGIKKESVLVASTGIIGRRLSVQKIKNAVGQLVGKLSPSRINKAKLAIMTTDTFSKEITLKIRIGKKVVTISGIAKGAGMIAPNMASPEHIRRATMLCFIFTDAYITQRALTQALDKAVDNSFNCITIDGCMSTNDSIIVLANAKAKNDLIDSHKHYGLFLEGLNKVCLELAKMLVKDAEGGTKFIKVEVNQAKSPKDARLAALAIANSNLFKTAVYGENPNFGRIVAAVGASGARVAEDKIKIKVSPLHHKEIDVYVSLGLGRGEATVYTSDLTEEYVKINAEYN